MISRISEISFNNIFWILTRTAHNRQILSQFWNFQFFGGFHLIFHSLYSFKIMISYPLKKYQKFNFASMYQLAILFAVYIAIHAVRKCTKNKQTKHIIITYILPIFVIIFAEILLLLLLGVIHILRQHNFRLFLTHPLCQHKYSTECQQSWPFCRPTHPVLWLT